MPAPSVAQAADHSGDLQLSGISKINAKLAVCLFDVPAKRSRWIQVGSQSDGIEVLSCDYDANRATIRINGQTRELVLRKASVQKGAYAAPALTAQAQQPQPPVGGPPELPPGPIDPSQIKPPVTREEKEREARMLVSDMLEMSMRQRKAYEAAKQKADQEERDKGVANKKSGKETGK